LGVDWDRRGADVKIINPVESSRVESSRDF